MSFLPSLDIAASGMSAQAERLRVVTENVANADTPGYRRKLVTFLEHVDRGSGAQLVELGPITLDDAELREVFEPQHPMADPETGVVQMSNVDLIVEIADAREAQRSYEANVNVFDQARRMYSGTLDLLRR